MAQADPLPSGRKNTKLRAFARYDGNGKIVPGSNILAREMPKTGNWIEGPVNLCCDAFSTNYGGQCATYSYVQGDVSRLLSYTDCDGTPRGPIGMNGIIDDVFCCLAGTASVDDPSGVTITFVQLGCTVLIPT